MNKPTDFNFVHFSVNITMTEGSYVYHDPRVQTNFEFSLPAEMLDAAKLATLLKGQVEALGPALKAEKARIEAEEKAKADIDALANPA